MSISAEKTMSNEHNGYQDKDTLRELYHDRGLTQKDIANKFGVSDSAIQYWMEKHGIKSRGGRTPHPSWVPYHTEKETGNTRWYQTSEQGSSIAVGIHQLLAIANGEDPHKVFGDHAHFVIHENGINWDNRPENVRLVPRSEFVNSHKKERKYTDEEMLEWIDSFVEHFGVVPSYDDISGWPGPSGRTYHTHFGTFTKAVKEAGHTPRGEQ